MQRTIICQPGLEISIFTGTEGPRHDPYSFQELTIERDGMAFMVHEGLQHFMEVNGDRVHNPFDVNESCRAITGADLKGWHKAIDKLEAHRRNEHRGHDVVDMAGYPGEHFCICNTCGGKVLDSSFDINAVI